MQHLTIRRTEEGQFQALSGDRFTDSIEVASPHGFAVAGRPDSDLVRELRWYLEEFLDYPFDPNLDRADRILDALKEWGKKSFENLFGATEGRDLYTLAKRGGLDQLVVQISSDDPQVLAWPWEALHDPQTGPLGQTAQILRRLNKLAIEEPVSSELPRDRINILLITARPYKRDVRYRSISRPLVELIANEKLPARVTLLRPPTLDQLTRHLEDHPNHYHIVHFDGHGAYGSGGTAGEHTFQDPEGKLVFENEKGGPDPQTGEQLSSLLREHCIPIVVLNACQSGMVDEKAEDAFASVAASMLRAGIRSVVAMSYSLYVTGGQKFLPDFYRRLFSSGRVSEAARAGRQKMLKDPGRVCARGRFPLQDWIVPVVYEQESIDLSFAAKAKREEETKKETLPEEAQDKENPYGFIGRDGAVLQLERALRRKPAGILIQGMGGIGKTTLARGFVQWLAATDGLGKGCFWFTFQDIRTAEFVINRMVEAVIGTQAMAAPMEEKIEALSKIFNDTPFLIIWDNFEVVKGIEGTSQKAQMSTEDCEYLLNFLKQLRGGRTKVIITSRSEEDWLGQTNRYKLQVGGLQGEERWEYCEVILDDLGLKVNREDPDLSELMEQLEGHPLAMRVLLPKLEDKSAGQLIEELQKHMEGFADSTDETEKKLYGTLSFVEKSLTEKLKPLLIPLSLHERFVDGNVLKYMAKEAGAGLSEEDVGRFLSALGQAGVLQHRAQNIYEMHPALTGFLRSRRQRGSEDEMQTWQMAFVELMGSLADHYAGKPLHEQRVVFYLHKSNFEEALDLAHRLELLSGESALTQSLAAYALNTRYWDRAKELFAERVRLEKKRGRPRGEAGALHQLGIIAQEQWDFQGAEQWYLKSLAISEKLGDEDGAAITYHQMGRIAEEQRDFQGAEKWYLKSLAISEKQGNEQGAAITYHQLGVIAAEQRDFQGAEKWYLKSLAIDEKQGNEQGASGTYHQLGMIAEEQRDFQGAEQWYLKSLAISEKQGNEQGAAISYHQLGSLAALQENWEESGHRFLKALQIFSAQNDPHHARQTVQNFFVAYGKADEASQAGLKQMWEETGLPWPKDSEGG